MEKRNPDKLRIERDTVFGTRAVMETILSGKEVDKLLVQKGLSNPLLKELISTAREYNVPIAQVPLEKLNRITRKNHQGAIGLLSAITYASLDNVITRCYEEGKNPFILILDRVTDVRNFGAIARSAECAGAHALIVPNRGSAPANSDAMKTSAGGLSHIPVCRWFHHGRQFR